MAAAPRGAPGPPAGGRADRVPEQARAGDRRPELRRAGDRRAVAPAPADPGRGRRGRRAAHADRAPKGHAGLHDSRPEMRRSSGRALHRSAAGAHSRVIAHGIVGLRRNTFPSDLSRGAFQAISAERLSGAGRPGAVTRSSGARDPRRHDRGGNDPGRRNGLPPDHAEQRCERAAGHAVAHRERCDPAHRATAREDPAGRRGRCARDARPPERLADAHPRGHAAGLRHALRRPRPASACPTPTGMWQYPGGRGPGPGQYPPQPGWPCAYTGPDGQQRR